MYMKLLQMDKWVKINHVKEVSDPIYLEHKRPTPNGLFSYEIFGIDQYDRSSIWAYIDLGARFLHPLAAINFKKYGSTFENIIYGLKTYRFENGKFIEDAENGETGIDFLYDHYDEIDWRETESISSTERIKFLRQGKDKIFITKFPVMPPFYRDINDNSSIGIPVVNDLYKKVISQSLALKRSGTFSFFGNMTKANIQKTLIEIFDHFIKQLKGKNGLMRKFVMGRNIDYGIWLVLSAPKIDGETYKDMQVDFDHFGYPLHACLSMLKPFIFHGVKEFFENEFLRSGDYELYDPKTKELKRVKFIEPELDYSDEFLNKKIEQFIKGHSTRFEPVMLPRIEGEDEGAEHYMYITGRFGSDNNVTRVMTWTDVFFIVATDVAKNKRNVLSRYPIEHFYSVCYPKIRVMSTIETIDAEIDGVHYPHYPVVIPGADSSNAFVNTLSPCNVYLAAMGGDYDGDSLPSRAIFTTEGNEDAEKFSRDKKNFLNLVGKNIRHTERDFVQLLYTFTLPPVLKELEDPN